MRQISQWFGWYRAIAQSPELSMCPVRLHYSVLLPVNVTAVDSDYFHTQTFDITPTDRVFFRLTKR